MCKNCGIKIEKEGGCPNMICKICNHEWCWICKEDFPVHTPECPNYNFYLEILEFQGLNGIEVGSDAWYGIGRRHGFFFWLGTFLLLLIVALPLMVAVNAVLTPCYMIIIIVTLCDISKSKMKRWWGVILTIICGILLYLAVPVTFCIITMP